MSALIYCLRACGFGDACFLELENAIAALVAPQGALLLSSSSASSLGEYSYRAPSWRSTKVAARTRYFLSGTHAMKDWGTSKLNTVEPFGAAAKAQSFTVAAGSLGITPSAISKAVQRMANPSWGSGCFQRTALPAPPA
jgi:hypothetical protein